MTTLPKMIVPDERFETWRAEQAPVLVMDCGIMAGDVLPGEPMDKEHGAVLYLTDGEDCSAEWFADVSTAVVRLACVMRAAEHDSELRHGDPEGFIRWSEQLFDQTVGLLSKRQ